MKCLWLSLIVLALVECSQDESMARKGYDQYVKEMNHKHQLQMAPRDVDVGSLISNVVGNVLDNFAILQPDLSGFDWNAGGRYVARGVSRFNMVWPFQPPVLGPFNESSLAVDPVAGVITFLFPIGYQYVIPAGFFYGDASGCYTVPNVTHTGFVDKYRMMRNWVVNFDPLRGGIIKTYGGSIRDPGFGPDYGTVMIQSNPKKQIVSYGFQQMIVQTIPAPPPTNFTLLNSKVVGSFVFNEWIEGPLPPVYTTLPADCAPATVKDYVAHFYPTGVYFNPYPV